MSRRRPTGAYVNVGTALLLLVLIGLTALTASEGPPPAIAEISPEANEQITEAPDEQASDAGRAEGGAAGTLSTTTIAPSAPTTLVPRTHRCVGEPPRQTEDPQSPPCVAYWEGDNGGATWQGVTRDEITVAVPNYDTSTRSYLPLFEAYFNDRFELYGRKIHYVDNYQSDDDMSGPEGGKAMAAKADEQYKIFASGTGDTDAFHYYAELARRGIPSVVTEVAFTDEYLNRSRHIYQYRMGVDSMFANVGDWACRRLVGGNATHAGGAQLGRPRKFGVILNRAWGDNPVSTRPLREQLEGCGESPTVIEFTCNCTGGFAPHLDPAEATGAIVQMQQDDVTSIICLCEPLDIGTLMRSATAQQYEPEWIVTDYVDLANTYVFKLLAPAVPDQAAHVFGVSFTPRSISAATTPAIQAILEVDPTWQFSNVGDYYIAIKYYQGFLMLTSAIQLAGPKLTPETFEAGLARTAFPNPLTVHRAGAVGMNDPLRSHSFTKDGVELWWSNDATDPYPGGTPGAYCYVDGGARHRMGGWPSGDDSSSGDPFFRGVCDNGIGI